MRSADADPVAAYAQAVTDGKVAANRLVRRACERHLEDLRHGAARGLRFECEAARHAIGFFGFLQAFQGRVGGPDLQPRPVAGLHHRLAVRLAAAGWAAPLPHRLLRRAAQERQEHAVGRHRASICWSPTASRVRRSIRPPPPATRPGSSSTRPSAWSGSSPALRRRVQVLINNLNVEASASRFMPLSSDASTMDGLNVHGAIIDELHAHKTRSVVDVLETATGARRQPLLFEITTAGYDRHSICFEHHDYAIKLLDGTCRTTAGSPSSPPPTRATTGPIRRSGARPTRASASRSRRTISHARPRRPSPCPGPRTPSGACI